MMKRNLIFRIIRTAALSLTAALMLTSCGWLHDEADCDTGTCLFTFTYDMNLKFADAFGPEVRSVHVLMFDTDGNLRYTWRVPSDELIGGNTLRVEVEPGEYDVLTWAGDYHLRADVTEGIVGGTTIEDHFCRVKRQTRGEITEHIEHFYHSLGRIKVEITPFDQPQRHSFNLTKDTNTVRIVLQQLSGDPVDLNDLTVTISDANGLLNYDNSLMEDEVLTYYPWYTNSGTVDITRGVLGAMSTEFTVSRLMADRDPQVTVTRPDGTKVFSISLTDYALLVKGNYHRDMDDQEYLDRQDEYNMTFFLDENLRWINSQIIINDWVIIDNNVSGDDD